MISFRNADLIDKIKIPLRIGDTVRWSPLGLSRADDPTYKNLIGKVTKLFDDRLGPSFVGVEWIGNNFEPIKIISRDNIEKVITTKADLIDRIKPKGFKRGDRVRLSEEGLNMLEELRDDYDGNIGTIIDAEFIFDDITIQWDRGIGTADNISHFGKNYLELA